MPDQILDGPKTGFSVLVGRWLRRSLAGLFETVVYNPSMDDQFDRDALATLYREHVQGKQDRAKLLWEAPNLALWYDRFRPAVGA